MKKGFFLILCFAFFGCEEFEDPCKSQNLNNGFGAMATFMGSDSVNRFKIISNTGRIENIEIWRSGRETYISDTSICWQYVSQRIGFTLRGSDLDLAFHYYLTPTINGEKLEFNQDFNLDVAKSIQFAYHIRERQELSNFMYLRENGNFYRRDFTDSLSIEFLQSYTTQMQEFKNVHVFSNAITDDIQLPNKAVVEMAIDSVYGLVQFATNSGEVWDVMYK